MVLTKAPQLLRKTVEQFLQDGYYVVALMKQGLWTSGGHYIVVWWNGEKIEIPVEEIVVDDILVLVTGQQVPADCVAIEGNAELNESLLTGESVPIKKEDGALSN